MGVTLATSALAAALVLAGRATAATAPAPTFGGEVVGAWYSYLPSMGANLYEAVGDSLSWPVLAPDGRNFDSIAVNLLDGDVRNAFDYGVSQVLMRVRPGGGAMNPFAGSADGWPVDTATYDSKNGEYLGSKDGLGSESYPPRVLTDDAPGNTSPWYDFVYAMASRYAGTTPDPKNPGELLPKIDYWSCVEEPDQKSFWYGTAADYFGGVGGDPAIGTLPTFYRAVKAANPDARIVAGGLASHEVGLYLLHELGRAHGNAYDASVRAYGATYFTTNYPIARLMALPLSDTDLFLNFENDPWRARARPHRRLLRRRRVLRHRGHPLVRLLGDAARRRRAPSRADALREADLVHRARLRRRAPERCRHTGERERPGGVAGEEDGARARRRRRAHELHAALQLRRLHAHLSECLDRAPRPAQLPARREAIEREERLPLRAQLRRERHRGLRVRPR
ncbi:MAG: hypothetical protein IPK07_11780 [Deltaproteobacteria bacterium]|nr:hypothetical protein [Deltaproteobacteria bacterium]